MPTIREYTGINSFKKNYIELFGIVTFASSLNTRY